MLIIYVDLKLGLTLVQISIQNSSINTNSSINSLSEERKKVYILLFHTDFTDWSVCIYCLPLTNKKYPICVKSYPSSCRRRQYRICCEMDVLALILSKKWFNCLIWQGSIMLMDNSEKNPSSRFKSESIFTRCADFNIQSFKKTGNWTRASCNLT